MAATAARIAEVLAGLRAASARLCTAAEVRRAHLPLGLPELDAALGGGLPRGKLTELTGARSSGRMSLTLGAVAEAQRTGELTAFVDASDAFDPPSAQAAGVLLPRLLWVRPRGLVPALQAADRILDAGGFGLVVLYLVGVRDTGRAPAPAPAAPPVETEREGERLAARTARIAADHTPSRLYGHDAAKLANREAGAAARSAASLRLVASGEKPAPRPEPHLERIPERTRRRPAAPVGAPAWARLQQRAEKSGAAVLLVAEHPLAGSFAIATLEARRGRADFTGLLDGVDGTVLIVRSKLGAPGGAVIVARAAG